MWVASHTRLDINYETGAISNTKQHPNVKMLQEANKDLAKLKSKKAALIS